MNRIDILFNHKEKKSMKRLENKVALITGGVYSPLSETNSDQSFLAVFGMSPGEEAPDFHGLPLQPYPYPFAGVTNSCHTIISVYRKCFVINCQPL